MAPAKRPAPSDVALHRIISERWSPRAFENRPVEPEKLRRVFEAARWAASSSNDQPWFYIVATRDDPENFRRILECLVERNQGWAKNAPVLALSVARMTFEANDKPNRHAWHDVGAASAALALEANSLDLEVHQMAGIDPEKDKKTFEIPDGYEVVAGIALGYPGDPATLPDPLQERERAPRQRKAVTSFVFTGQWGKTSPIVVSR